MLNLASTIVLIEGLKIILKCTLTGPTQTLSLSSMRSLQAYSPAHVLEVKAMGHDGSLLLVIEISDGTCRVSVSDSEIVRICKKRSMMDRMFGD